MFLFTPASSYVTLFPDEDDAFGVLDACFVEPDELLEEVDVSNFVELFCDSLFYDSFSCVCTS